MYTGHDAYVLLQAAMPPGPPPVVVVDRPPLPPFDEGTWETSDPAVAPTFHPVYTELWSAPAPFPDARWFRGDAWGVTVEGLPAIEGGATGPAQSRVLTYMLGRYRRDWEDRILDAHLGRGYTHFSLSPQDEIAAGMSPADYVAMSVRVRQAGFYVHHLMRSKYYTDPALLSTIPAGGRRPRRLRTHLEWPSPWTPQVGVRSFDVTQARPLIEALLTAGAMQVHTPAWECNYWSPTAVRTMIDYDSSIIGTACLIALHFFPHYISWQQPDETPTDFWEQNYGKVDSVLYQADPYWSAGMMAARMTDALDRLAPGGIWGLGDSGRGHPIDVVGWETIATCQYNNINDGNNRVADEDMGNLKGYELSCAPGRMPVYGFGNGARWPDGAAL